MDPFATPGRSYPSSSSLDDGRPPTTVSPLWASVVVLSLTGIAVCMTSLFLSMRAVMEIGGSCGSGGPYVYARACPKGTGLTAGLSIPLGLVLVGLHLLAGFRVKAPLAVWLAWPALFLSLGWNFWEFGLDAPDGSGLVWGWLVCGVVFVLMGGMPVVAVVGHLRRNTFRWSRTTAWWAAYAVASGAGIVLGSAFFDAVTR